MVTPGDYVLLPIGTHSAPYDGIVYAEVLAKCRLDSTNRFNISVRKRRVGWTVRLILDDEDDIEELDVPKSYPLTQYPSASLAKELKIRPKSYLGMYVGKALRGDDDAEYLNYGQVISVELNEEESSVVHCTVQFRDQSDGSQLIDVIYPGHELDEYQVTQLHYVLGLGVGQPFLNAESRVPEFSQALEFMSQSTSHATFIKKFHTIVVARPDQEILDAYLETREINLNTLLDEWVGLQGYLPAFTPAPVRPVGIDLSSTFEKSCAFGNVPMTPATPANVIIPGQPAPSPMDPLHANNLRRQEQRAPLPVVLPAVGTKIDAVLGSHHAPVSKHAFIPTDAQLAKHMLTFKEGTYGTSKSRLEAMNGIEVVYMQENLVSVNQKQALVRSYCIMVGELQNTPLHCWADASMLAFNYEEAYEPIKWTKLPVLEPKGVNDIDEFWVLYQSMQDAAHRYYVDSYSYVLTKIRTNLTIGLSTVGGREGFVALQASTRKTIIAVMVAYMRMILNRFIMECLPHGDSVDPIQWANREASSDAPFFQQHIRANLTTLMVRDMSIGPSLKNRKQRRELDEKPDGEEVEEKNWSHRPPADILKLIPKQDGKNMCLLTYTSKGCKKTPEECAYTHQKENSPGMRPAVQAWIKSNYGSYVKM